MSTKTTLAALLALGFAAAPDEKYSVDGEGFIRNWLVLGPIKIEDSAADEIVKDQIPDEGRLKPKAGEKLTVRGKELTWKAYKTEEYYVDFHTWLGKKDDEKEENVAGYLVAYVWAGAEMTGLNLLWNSNDQGRIYLNGKELGKFTEGRSMEKDQDKVQNVTLQKGENVVVLKVINETNNWGGGARFTDKSGAAVTGVKITTPSKP